MTTEEGELNAPMSNRTLNEQAFPNILPVESPQAHSVIRVYALFPPKEANQLEAADAHNIVNQILKEIPFEYAVEITNLVLQGTHTIWSHVHQSLRTWVQLVDFMWTTVFLYCAHELTPSPRSNKAGEGDEKF